MINAAKEHIKTNKVPYASFEFQMLYGIRGRLQQQLADDGYKMRVYVPYGTEWYPYYMRRLAERPANVWFIASNFFRR
jgi:proline dehydrogenase